MVRFHYDYDIQTVGCGTIITSNIKLFHNISAFCEIDEFYCGEGQCIPETQVCDRTPQCNDRSDEINCGEYDSLQ